MRIYTPPHISFTRRVPLEAQKPEPVDKPPSSIQATTSKAKIPLAPPPDIIAPAIDLFLSFAPQSTDERDEALQQACAVMHFALHNESVFESFAAKPDALERVTRTIEHAQKMGTNETFSQLGDDVTKALIAFNQTTSQRLLSSDERLLFASARADRPDSWLTLLRELPKRYGDDRSMADVLSASQACLVAYDQNPLALQAALARLVDRAQHYNSWHGPNKVVAVHLALLANQAKTHVTSTLTAWANQKPQLRGDFNPREPFLPARFLSSPSTSAPAHHHAETRPSRENPDRYEMRFLNEYDEFQLGPKNQPLTEVVAAENVEKNAIHHHTQKSERPLFVGEPSFKDVEQGKLGDCYLLASLAAMARKSPASIRAMVQEHPDFVMVRLFEWTPKGPREVWQQVPKSVVVDPNNQISQAKGEASWPAFVEKAYVMFNGESLENISGTRGATKNQLYALTGKGSATQYISSVGFPHRLSCYSYIEPLPDDLAKYKVVQRRFLRSLCQGLSPQGVQKVLAFDSVSLNRADSEKFMTHLRRQEMLRIYGDPILNRLSTKAKIDIATQVELSPDFRKILCQFLEQEGRNPKLMEQIAEQSGVPLKQLEGAVYMFNKYAAKECVTDIKKHLDGGGFAYLSSKPIVSRQETGIVGGHAYEVVGVVEKVNQPYIRVRNPWGHSGAKYEQGRLQPDPKAGEFDLRVEDVMKTMQAYTMGYF